MWTVYEMACFLFHVQGTSSCDHAATSSAVLYRIRNDVGVPQLQFIDRVLPRCEQRQVPTVAFFQPGFRVLQYIDKVIDVLGTRLLYGGLSKNFTFFFYVLLALFAWNLDLISLSPLFWQPLAPVRCDSPRLLLDEFRLFSTLKMDSDLLAVHTWKFGIISTSSIRQSPRASVYIAFGRIHIFSGFPAQFAHENLDIISTCSHMAVGRGFRRF